MRTTPAATRLRGGIPVPPNPSSVSEFNLFPTKVVSIQFRDTDDLKRAGQRIVQGLPRALVRHVQHGRSQHLAHLFAQQVVEAADAHAGVAHGLAFFGSLGRLGFFCHFLFFLFKVFVFVYE